MAKSEKTEMMDKISVQKSLGLFSGEDQSL